MIDKEKTLLGFVRESNFNELNLNIEQDHGLTQFRFSDVPNKSRQAHASLCHVIISRSSNKNIYRPNLIAFGVETLEEGLIKLIKNIRTIDCQSLNLYDKRGNHFLHYAAMLGYVNLLSEFHKQEVFNQLSGETPLMTAVRFNQLDCVKWLSWTQCWPLEKNQNGHTALDIAKQLNCKQSEIVLHESYLRQEKIILISNLVHNMDLCVEDPNLRALHNILCQKEQVKSYLLPLL